MGQTPFFDDPIRALKEAADRAPTQPLSRTRTSYGLTIHLKVGNKRAVVGGVHEFSERQGIQLDREYTVARRTRGRPAEVIPQNLSVHTLTLQRYDLFGDTLEQVFGTDEWATLADQSGPMSIRTVWRDPVGTTIPGLVEVLGPSQRVYQYDRCYFADFGRAVRAAGDRIVGTNAVVVWTDKRIVQ